VVQFITLCVPKNYAQGKNKILSIITHIKGLKNSRWSKFEVCL